ncbi:HYC_CC_PP family protein [Christiangramia sabulilitoris]|uniref:Secreted protein n=1 Tax=Christiangramia sabulilitoris TaxID=2583991 RepID=A0A550I7X8_9FLAO|nr:hypothetical protein [Christiangramia sabulilitoris]TRO67061.1 hypothetical protein FGM01_04020 [Christiangramia sabulilitoris]
MKKAFQHIISLCMAFMVMLSTMSFTVDKHFCGSHLVDQAVFSKAKTCGMQMSTDMEGHCCTNQKVSVEGQDELKVSFDSFDFQQQLFITTFSFTYFNLFESLPKQIIPFKDYSPPLLVTDIQLADQVFLI